MATQHEKAKAFKALHERNKAFIIPNPWDLGTARVLAHLGFEALATTSMGFAFSVGRADYGIERHDAIDHVRAIAAEVDVPVSADLENGFGHDPEAAAETIRQAGAAGAVGGSIEDATGDEEEPIYEIRHAADRIRAAVEAKRGMPFPFVLTARAENYLHGRPDLPDTIARLQAYQEAGSDVLYAPGLSTKEEIAAVLSSVDRPVNVLMGMGGIPVTLYELSEMGVRRISVGGALCRTSVGALLNAAREMLEHGTFKFADSAVSGREVARMLARE